MYPLCGGLVALPINYKESFLEEERFYGDQAQKKCQHCIPRALCIRTMSPADINPIVRRRRLCIVGWQKFSRFSHSNQQKLPKRPIHKVGNRDSYLGDMFYQSSDLWSCLYLHYIFCGRGVIIVLWPVLVQICWITRTFVTQQYLYKPCDESI